MSTTTNPLPPTGPGLSGAALSRSERRREADAAHNSGVERTVRAAAATALGVLPLTALFSDIRWLADVLAAVIIVGGVAAVLRFRQRPHVWHTWTGVALLIPWLTWRFAPTHAIGHVLPSAGTFTDISHLLDQVRETTSNGVAPVPSSHATTLVLAAVCGLLAAFVDLVAVVGRRPALAGVPLLVVFTVAGAVRRHPVSWVWFGATAIGFLLLLSIDARDEVRSWGRVIPRAGEARPTAALAVSGPRIAIIAVAVAVLLPLLVPARTSNLLANAFHNGKTGTGGKGSIGTGGVSLNPFAYLRGELTQPKPVTLFTVESDDMPPGVTPYYLRANVLSTYSPTGWTASGHNGEPLSTTDFQTNPQTPLLTTTSFTVHMVIAGLSDNPPVFANPQAVGGVDARATRWDAENQLLVGTKVNKHQTIDESVEQPAPTVADLQSAPAAIPTDIQGAYLQGANTVPQYVTGLVAQLTAGKTTEYAKARAINDYFTTTSNGFTYSLQTAAGDSGSELVDFLRNKVGFCQQFAAAMGIMLRVAGVPARVVLGYTHAPLNDNHAFTVSTTNAHAWVEAYFPGLGWVPFDPTPITPSAGAATADVPWAPHPTIGAANPHDTLPASRGASSSKAAKPQVPDGAAGPKATTPTSHGVPWALLGSVLALALIAGAASTPAVARGLRRRRRLHSAGHGDPDPLWAELSDTAIDLGYVWSPARTPRQVVGWLAGDVGPDAARSLRDLAAAVESARYAPPSSAQGPGRSGLVRELKDVEAQLRARRSRSTRIRSRLLPASLGWLPRRLPWRGRRRR